MFTRIARPTRLITAALAALALALTIVVPGARAAATGCPEQSSAQIFMPWMDPAWYVQAPNGGLEGGSLGWQLLGGAAIQKGNEPYSVGGSQDRRSLSLPAGASATTAPMCIAVDHPTLRLFVRNAGDRDAALRVSVAYRDGDEQWQSVPIGLLTAASEWAPAPVLPVTVNLLALTGDQQAAFRFEPVDDRGDWSLDDVYVDPYSK